MSNLLFEGQLESSNGTTLHAKLEMYLFQEDDSFIVYCPALDLSAYGDSEEEAKKAFDKTFELHILYCLRKKTLYEDLKNHGWNIRSKKQKNMKQLTC
nr:hypothetical protein [uncultured Bacteroides sp.]